MNVESNPCASGFLGKPVIVEINELNDELNVIKRYGSKMYQILFKLTFGGWTKIFGVNSNRCAKILYGSAKRDCMQDTFARARTRPPKQIEFKNLSLKANQLPQSSFNKAVMKYGASVLSNAKTNE